MSNGSKICRYQSLKTLSQSGTARVVPVVGILLLIALAALAAPQYQDRDHDRDHGWDRDSFVRVSHERMMQDFGGGNGGRPSPDAVCPEQSVAVGFHIQTGEFINQAWLDCAPIRPDGRLGRELRMTERTGSRGGRPVSDAICPEGFALRGLQGRTGGSIDEAAGVCSPLREIANRSGNPRSEMTQAVMRPRPGGRPAEAFCPAGAVVTGFRSTSGEYMDHLWLLCSELHGDHDQDRDHEHDHDRDHNR
jgi:hypothetical protein